MTDVPQIRWSVGRSIARELDVALSAFSPGRSMVGVSEELAAFVNAVPADWKAQWTELLGPVRPWVSVLSDLASTAAVLTEEDYAQATLAMRQLTVAMAAQSCEEDVRHLGLSPDPSLPPEERILDLTARMVPVINQRLGLEARSESGLAASAMVEVRQSLRIMRDGDLHARFWLWLDRFYFEFYRPWRQSRLPEMDARERQLLAVLGAPAGEGDLPPLNWLPPQNPLIFRPELAQAVANGRTNLFFWTEPFGFFDYLGISPGVIAVSYGTPSTSVAEMFRAEAELVAERAKAISDPTRLMILRIIRNFGMDNTQMADYLGVARPTVSIHAKILREAGLIETRQVGRASMHTLNPAAIRRLFADLEQFLRITDTDE